MLTAVYLIRIKTVNAKEDMTQEMNQSEKIAETAGTKESSQSKELQESADTEESSMETETSSTEQTEAEAQVKDSAKASSPQTRALETNHGIDYTRSHFGIDASYTELSKSQRLSDVHVDAKEGVNAAFGFRGMSANNFATVGNTTLTPERHYYFEPLIWASFNLENNIGRKSFLADGILSGSGSFENTSINPYVNGKWIRYDTANADSPYGVLRRTGINSIAYQMTKEMYFFKKDNIEERYGELKAVMYTNDGFDVVMSILIDKRKGAGEVRYKFYNNTSEAIDMGIMEYGEIFSSSQTQSGGYPVMQSLGNDRGFFYRDDYYKDQLNIELQNGRAKWLTDYNHYTLYTENAVDINNRNRFGNNFLTPGIEGTPRDRGATLLSKTKAFYQFGTDVKTLQPGEAMTVGANYYYGGLKEPQKLTASTEKTLYYDTATELAPIDFDLTDIEGTSDDLYIIYNDEEPEKIQTLDLSDKESISGTVKIDASRLHSGENHVSLYAENDLYDASNEENITIEMRKLTAEVAIVKTPLDSSLDLMAIDKLIKSHNTIHTPPILTYQENGEPDTSKIGFVWSKINLADKETSSVDNIDLEVPTNIYGDNTVFNDTELVATDVKNVELSIRQVQKAATEAELFALIAEKSELKSWFMNDGTSTDAQIISTTVKPQEGTYEATIEVTGRSSGKVSRKIQVEVGGDLNILNIPSEIDFEQTPIRSKLSYVNKVDPVAITLDTSLGVNWTLTVIADNFKTSDGEAVSDILINRRNGVEEFVSASNSSIVYTGNEETASSDYKLLMPKDDGLLLKVRPGQVKSKSYTSTVTWTLTEDPTR